MNIARLLLKRYLSFLFALMFGFLLLPLTAQAKGIWVPSIYKDDQLNTETFCTLRTEYPVYKTDATTVHYVMQNNSRQEISYGVITYFERKQADGWYTYTDPEVDNILIAVDVLPGAPRSEKLDTTHTAGPLPAGEYRLIKEFSLGNKRALFCSYFTVAENGYDSAYLSGYTPLLSLPKNYTREQALSDGAFYVDVKGKAYNKEKLTNFLEKIRQYLPAKLRILQYTTEGDLVLCDISYGWNNGDFLLEQDATRDRLGTKTISRSYYPDLILHKANGKTRLMLSEWFLTPVKGASDWTLLPDIRIAGASKITKLMHSPYYHREEAAYLVYSPDGKQYAGYDAKAKEIYYTTPNGVARAAIADPKSSITAIVDMELKGNRELVLTFRTAGGGRCTITFHTLAGKITDSVYQ